MPRPISGVPVIEIRAVAIALIFEVDRKISRKIARDGSGKVTIARKGAIVAISSTGFAAEFRAWIPGDDLDKSPRRVTTEQGALRALINFYSFDTDEI